MKSTLILTILSFLAVAFAVVLDVPEVEDGLTSELAVRRHHKKNKCAKGIHLIAIRGNGVGGGPYGDVKPLVKSLLKAIPGSTSQPVPYPKNQTIREANGVAVSTMTKEIESYVKMCPKSKVVLVGYSEGAGITMNTICGTDSFLFAKTKKLPKKYTKNIIASIVYSDGTRVSGEKYDFGSCKRDGSYPRSNAPACAPYAPVIRSYCFSEDKFCCAGGRNKSAHYQYFKTYDTAVTKFVVSQFHKKS